MEDFLFAATLIKGTITAFTLISAFIIFLAAKKKISAINTVKLLGVLGVIVNLVIFRLLELPTLPTVVILLMVSIACFSVFIIVKKQENNDGR